MNIAAVLSRYSIVFSGSILLFACATQEPVSDVKAPEAKTEAAAVADPGIPGAESESNKAMQEKFGIEVASLRLTAANYFLNFKYKVLDPDKASPLMDHKLDPTITLERNGAKFAVPFTEKLGSIRSAPKFAKAGRNYFVFFGNPGGYIKPGELVTIQIGDMRLEHLQVM